MRTAIDQLPERAPIEVLIATHGRTSLISRTILSVAESGLPSAYRGAIVVENGARCGVSPYVYKQDARGQARGIEVSAEA